MYVINIEWLDNVQYTSYFIYIMLDIVDYLLLVKQECNMPENYFIFNVEHNYFI